MAKRKLPGEEQRVEPGVEVTAAEGETISGVSAADIERGMMSMAALADARVVEANSRPDDPELAKRVGESIIAAQVNGEWQTLLVEMPTGPWTGYTTRNIELRPLTAFQTERLHSILAGLIRDGAMMRDGSPVKVPQHVFRWILENAA